MKRKLVYIVLSLLLMAPSVIMSQRSFVAGKGAFLLDGKPFVVKAAELHYPRIPKPYWEQRIQLCNHETRPAEDMIEGIRQMLDRNISFSLYMTHGGTNWGHWAGANSPDFAPDVTSYDYDAPISESGQPTPKYWARRFSSTAHISANSTVATARSNCRCLPALRTPVWTSLWRRWGASTSDGRYQGFQSLH
jgi:hypothetical protein